MAERPEARADEPSWQVYDGGPEGQSDGLEPTAAAAAPRWPWVTAAVAAVVAVGVLAVVVAPPGPAAGPGDGAAVTAQGWHRVEPSLAAGAVLVMGAGEADGIVLSSDGLVATSLSRLLGERRRPAEFGFSVDGVPATLVATDEDLDLALLRAPGLTPAEVARPGAAVGVGDRVTLLDVQGGDLPTRGIAVEVAATGETCARAGSPSRPSGFRFSLDEATAEPGAALVGADGTVVGLYFGGDEASRHCAVPIADVLASARRSGAID